MWRSGQTYFRITPHDPPRQLDIAPNYLLRVGRARPWEPHTGFLLFTRAHVEVGYDAYKTGKIPTEEIYSLLYQKSPVAHVANVKTPTLIMLGKDDRRVPPQLGLEYHKALIAQGVTSKWVYHCLFWLRVLSQEKCFSQWNYKLTHIIGWMMRDVLFV